MIAVIDYNAGNTYSVVNALKRLGCESLVTRDKQTILNADKVIFPGVGEATSAMRYISKYGLQDLIPTLTKPFLGICLGLQLLCKSSEEGDCECIGIFDITVRKFPSLDIIPHMGWNNCKRIQGQMFQNVSENDDVYFVHNYYAELSEHTTAQCDYILPFSAALQKDNFYAVQFHPEKSAVAGEKVLNNFLAL